MPRTISRTITPAELRVGGWLTGSALVLRDIIALAEAQPAIKEVMDKSAVAVEQRAKDKLGFYQPAVGPFEAWAELHEATQESRAYLGYQADQPLVREHQLYDDITHDTVQENGQTVAYVGIKRDAESAPYAAAMELGTIQIGGVQEPRSYLGASAFELQRDIVANMADAAANVMTALFPIMLAGLGSGE